MEILLGLFIGVGLSAACGFRVFVPLFIVSLGAHSGHVALAPGFGWIGTTPALVAFGAATLCEVVGFLVPWLDHGLDVLAAPLAIVAGTVLTASFISDMSPFLRWTLAAIAGGGIAGGAHAAMAASRYASTATTGGLGNPFFSLAEGLASLGMSLLALFLPAVAVIVAVCLFIYALTVLLRRSRRAFGGPSGTTKPAGLDPEFR